MELKNQAERSLACILYAIGSPKHYLFRVVGKARLVKSYMMRWSKVKSKLKTNLQGIVIAQSRYIVPK